MVYSSMIKSLQLNVNSFSPPRGRKYKKALPKCDTIKVTELAKRTGLDRGTVADFIYNKTKNANIETVAKIADIYGCSIDELVSSIENKSIKFDAHLAKNCVIAIDECLKRKKLNINFKDFLLILKAIYSQNMDGKSKKVDAKYVSTYIDDVLKHTYAQRQPSKKAGRT